jgi:G protein-coupled receptor 64
MFDYYVELIITLSASLLIMNISYILFSFITWDKHMTLCLLVGSLLHYSLLSSFFWMLSLSFLQYLIFNKVLVIVNRYYAMSAGLALGLPLIIVGVIMAVDWKFYLHPNN